MDAFQIEKIRTELAKNNNLKKLKKLYLKSMPEIKDINTSFLWDDLNSNCKDYNGDNNPMAMDRVKFVVNELKGTKVKILNIGIGSAILENQYFKKHNNHKGIEWYGIDISRKSVNKAKKKFPFANFNVADTRVLNFNNDLFDYIVALEVIEHIRPSEVMGVLSLYFKFLKNKGKLIISVPLNEGLEKLYLKGLNPNGHLRVYSPELIKAELILNKFEFLHEHYLYAFKKHYKIKKFIINYLMKKYREPNNIIVIAQKP